jgi:hypothetical protein
LGQCAQAYMSTMQPCLFPVRSVNELVNFTGVKSQDIAGCMGSTRMNELTHTESEGEEPTQRMQEEGLLELTAERPTQHSRARSALAAPARWFTWLFT